MINLQAILESAMVVGLLTPPLTAAGTDTATFAGGCFWCMQPPFDKADGVRSVVVGYTGGHTINPTYEDVCTGNTGHYEAIQVVYDPAKISYSSLLEIFWHNIDPTDNGGQFADRGSQYHSAIFYHTEEQKTTAEASKEQLDKTGKFDRPVATRILKASVFYPAEKYHQQYYLKCAVQYNSYKRGSGREGFIEKNWGIDLGLPATNRDTTTTKYARPSLTDLKKKLTDLQFAVTQKNGTEPPFRNDFWNEHRDGIYVDIVSGQPLFSSRDKFDSDCGWPSFTKPIDKSAAVEREDDSHGMVRTEVRSSGADSHLGHLFNDGPLPAGTRYCINSASLRFVPKEDLAKEGYGDYVKLFK